MPGGCKQTNAFRTGSLVASAAFALAAEGQVFSARSALRRSLAALVATSENSSSPLTLTTIDKGLAVATKTIASDQVNDAKRFHWTAVNDFRR